MIYAIAAVGLVVVAIAVFIWRQNRSVRRGYLERDERIAELIDPIASKVAARQEVSRDAVAKLAALPHARLMLHGMLKHFERLDLFPPEYLDVKSQGAAQLAYWMLHPHEYGDPPEAIELVESARRPLGPTDEEGEFLVFRFKLPQGHWAHDDGWLLGVAGPYLKDDMPYAGISSAFARCGDKYGDVNPSELVDWYIKMLG